MPTAIVTGAGGALGKGICTSLVADGWTVAIVDMMESHARETLDALGGGAHATMKVLNVNDLAAVQRVFAEVASKHPDLAALVNAAGGRDGADLKGTINACYAVLPGMIAAQQGGIVSLAAFEGLRGDPDADAADLTTGACLDVSGGWALH